MSKILDRMIRESRKGYINDGTQIMQTMNILGRYTIAQLEDMVSSDTKKNIDIMMEAFLNEEHSVGVEEKDRDRVRGRFRFAELICLMDGTMLDGRVRDAPADGRRYTDEELVYIKPYRYVGIFYLIRIFQEAQKADYHFRAFFAFQAEAFFRYLEALSRDPDRWSAFQAGAESLKLKLNDQTTVGDFLNQLQGIQRTPWSPWKAMEEYRRKLLYSYRLTAELLIDSFRYTYPEFFDQPSVLHRCGHLVRKNNG